MLNIFVYPVPSSYSLQLLKKKQRQEFFHHFSVKESVIATLPSGRFGELETAE